ncbi:MAG: hypothetical protein IJS91_07250 [Bacteroidales bacterium]|nr:hypothetical protein [Bacteroidales bacterium]
MNKPFHYITLLALTLVTLFAVSCKDDEETETKLIMEGTISFPFPSYVQKNSHVTVEVSGITHPTDVTYKWVASSIFQDTVVSRLVSFRVPDSLGTFGITALALADGYYQVSSSVTFTTIDTVGGAALTGLQPSTTSFTDPRDGRIYPTVKIGALEWFASNLGWDGTGGVYCNSPVTEGLLGRYYTWKEATGNVSGTGLAGGPQGACPAGWKVPTKEDFEDLATTLLGSAATFTDTWATLGDKLSAPAYFNGERMWPYSPYNDHSNTSGWNAIPVGGATIDHSNFTGFGNYAFFWCATEKDADKAYYRYIYADLNTFPMASTSKTDFAASVRCVRAL